MSTQISAPVRIVALVGVLLALAMGAWTFAAGRHAGSSSADTGETLHPIAAARSAAAKLDAHNRATAAGKTAGAKAAAKPAAAPKPASVPTAAPDGTPTLVASTLRAHRVVAVLLYDPASAVDASAADEARLGAADAHVGFLRVSILDARRAEPFAGAYGVLDTPSVLFFARPGKLVQTLTGFADRDTVAQASLDAARGLVAPS
jgi:hypothetical protein